MPMMCVEFAGPLKSALGTFLLCIQTTLGRVTPLITADGVLSNAVCCVYLCCDRHIFSVLNEE